LRAITAVVAHTAMEQGSDGGRKGMAYNLVFGVHSGDGATVPLGSDNGKGNRVDSLWIRSHYKAGVRDSATRENPSRVFFGEHRAPLLVLLLSTAWIVAVGTRHPHVAAPLWHLPSALLLAVVVADLALIRLLAFRLRHRVSWKAAWTDLRQGALSTDRLAGLFLAAVIGRWLMLNAVGWKLTIPIVHPFAFDAPLAALDFALHGGDPARLFPVEGFALRAVDAFYYGWFPIYAGVILWWGWQPPSHSRRRFLLALCLTWTVSAILAVLVSSAGPIYYEALTGVPIYDTSPLAGTIAYGMQEAVWSAYLGADTGVIAGIAAFPSVHVALPALFALSSRGRVRWAFWGMCAVTFIGSVVLLWHYALDGYAGVIVAWACWRVAR
jgi:hypothetical protein